MTGPGAEERAVIEAGADLPTEAIQARSLGLTAPPAEIVARAREVAGVLAEVIEKQRLFVELTHRNRRTGEIKVSRHITVEGWTTTGILCGGLVGDPVVSFVEWCKPIPGIGYVARVSARTGSGAVLATAEAMVSRQDEAKWRSAPDHQLASMAQTRATSKALRLALGWVVALTGFETTPAEELDAGEPAPAPPPPAFTDPEDAQEYRDEIEELFARYFPAVAEESRGDLLALVLNVKDPSAGWYYREWASVGATMRDAWRATKAVCSRIAEGEEPAEAARAVDAAGKIRARLSP